MIGRQLGPYTVVDKLGESGMAEVYAAEDTRLKRQVAIKALPAGVTGDETRGRRPSVQVSIVPNYLTVLHRLTGAK